MGPVSSSELKGMAASGQLRPDDLVWADGMPDWMPASKLKGLFSEVPRGIVPAPRPVPPIPPVSEHRPAPRPSGMFWLIGGGVVGVVGLMLVLGVGGAVLWMKRGPSSSKSGRDEAARTAITEPGTTHGPGNGGSGSTSPEDDPALAHLKAGHALLQKDQFDEAIVEFTSAIEKNPRLAPAYCHRGFAYMAKGNLDKAMVDCNRAIDLDPKIAEAYGTRSGIHLDRGNLDGAIADASKALDLGDARPFPYYIRGTAYVRQDRYDQGIADLTRAIERNPSLGLAYNNRSIAYKKKGDQARWAADVALAKKYGGYVTGPAPAPPTGGGGGSPAKERARLAMLQAEANYKQALAMYEAEYQRYVQQRNTALQQSGRMRAAGVRPPPVQPPDRTLAMKKDAAYRAYLQAKKVYEQTP
jgi:tetratricopeptide (TPR) repeat protein